MSESAGVMSSQVGEAGEAGALGRDAVDAAAGTSLARCTPRRSVNDTMK